MRWVLTWCSVKRWSLLFHNFLDSIPWYYWFLFAILIFIWSIEYGMLWPLTGSQSQLNLYSIIPFIPYVHVKRIFPKAQLFKCTLCRPCKKKFSVYPLTTPDGSLWCWDAITTWYVPIHCDVFWRSTICHDAIFKCCPTMMRTDTSLHCIPRSELEPFLYAILNSISKLPSFITVL